MSTVSVILVITNIHDLTRQFADAQSDLLKTLDGKAPTVASVTQVGSPVAAVLRSLENVVDVSNLPMVS